MKKRVVISGVIVMALAALPVVGAAAEARSSVTDEIRVTIEEGCTFIADSESQTNHSVTLGQGSVVKDIEGVVFNVTCNGRDFEGSWKITARGESGAKLSDGAGNEIASSNSALSGSASNWQFKMNVTGAAQVSGNYLNYSQVPTEDTQIASNTGDAATEDATVQAMYGVSASDSQTPGTYTGQVIYTLTNTAPES